MQPTTPALQLREKKKCTRDSKADSTGGRFGVPALRILRGAVQANVSAITHYGFCRRDSTGKGAGDFPRQDPRYEAVRMKASFFAVIDSKVEIGRRKKSWLKENIP